MAKHKMDQIIVVLPGILGSVLDLRRRPFVDEPLEVRKRAAVNQGLEKVCAKPVNADMDDVLDAE